MNWLSLLSENPFYELAIILLLAAVLSSIGQILRQPLIVMFIALGVDFDPMLVRNRQSQGVPHDEHSMQLVKSLNREKENMIKKNP